MLVLIKLGVPRTIDERSLKPPVNSPSNQRPKARPLYLVASVQPSRSGNASLSRANSRRRIRGRILEPYWASNYEDKRISLALISQVGPTWTRVDSKTCVYKRFRAYTHPRSIWICITGWDHDPYRRRVVVEEDRAGVDHTWNSSNHRWTISWTTHEQSLEPKTESRASLLGWKNAAFTIRQRFTIQS